MEVVVVPEAHVGDGHAPVAVAERPAADGQVTGDWKNFRQDMATIAAQRAQPAPQGQGPGEGVEAPPAQTPQAQTQPPQQEPAQPGASQAAPAAATPAPAAPEIPAKFLGPDGKLDEGRIVKSYLEAERALKKAQQERARGIPQAGPAAPGEGAAVPPAAPPAGSFEAQIEADVKMHGLGPVMARLFEAARQSAYDQTMSEIGQFRTSLEDKARSEELSAIGKQDPWVLTPQGFDTLHAVLQSKPWLMQAQQPWTEAYIAHKGEATVRGTQTHTAAPQVATPIPKAPAASQAPAGAAARGQVVRLDTREAIEAHLANLTPEQQTAFWAKYGLRY